MKGEKEDEEGSTSTNNCDIVVNDAINHIIDNDYVITDAVVVGLILSYVTDCCHTWCGGDGLGVR